MTDTILDELNRGTTTAPQPSFEPTPVLMGVDLIAVKAMLDTLIERVKELEEQGLIKSTAIYDLDEAHSMRQPIQVVLQESEEIVLASWPELHLYAEGDTPNEAIATLKREIVSLYDDLSSTPRSELGVLPSRWLKTLKSVVLDNA